MRAFVHFSVGVSGMLFILTFVDLEYRREFLLMYASGLWALVPDVGWLLLRIGYPGIARVWQSIFHSWFGNVFWFHSFIDGLEPVDRVVEMTSGFFLLGFAVTVYYVANDWDRG